MDTIIIGKNTEVLVKETQCPGIEIWKWNFERAELGHMSCWMEEKFLYLYVQRGMVSCQMNQERVKIYRGEGAFINYRTLFRLLGSDDENCEIYVFMISGDVFGQNEMTEKYVRTLSEMKQLPYLKLERSGEESKKILNILEKTAMKAEEKESGYPLEIKGDIYGAWAALYRETQRRPPEMKKSMQREAEKLQRMLIYIHENYKKKITLGEIAENLGVSTGDYCRFFKKHMGQTPFEYLQVYRIEKSIPELLEKADRITEVSLRHGFNGSSYYAETFRKEMGCTPGEYRKWYLGKEKRECPLKKTERTIQKKESITVGKREVMPAHLL